MGWSAPPAPPSSCPARPPGSPPAVAGPLDGVRVLDLTRYGPGPYCAMILDDLGADVVVVDQARAGAAEARVRPMIGPDGVLGGAGVWMRRNHRRIALDLKHSDGREVAARLLDRADVLVESFRPGVAARLGFDAAALAGSHPRLVYCSISGFGQDGPHRDRAGHDLNYLGWGGYLAGSRGESGDPAVPSTVLADLAAGGMQAVIGILAALLVRERTGRGQRVDASLVEGVVALMAPMLVRLLNGDVRRWSLLSGESPWYTVYATADGRHLTVAAVEPWFWSAVCDAVGRPEWVDGQFDTATWPQRRAELAAIVAGRTLAEWREVFDAVDACVDPVASFEEVLAEPHHRARGTFVEVAAPGGGSSLQVRPLPRLSETPASIRRGAVEWGGDADAVLAELGYDDAARRRLRESGAAGGVVQGAEAAR
jgi:alpha-methylacyl-CoA racemase